MSDDDGWKPDPQHTLRAVTVMLIWVIAICTCVLAVGVGAFIGWVQR